MYVALFFDDIDEKCMRLTKPLEGHYIITEVDPNTSEPLLPKNNAKKRVRSG
jgi:hypothetical protein